MPKYIVYADITHNYSIEVEAETAKDAEELASNTPKEKWDYNDHGYLDIYEVSEYN